MLPKISMAGWRSGLILALIAICLSGCAGPTRTPAVSLALTSTLPPATPTPENTHAPAYDHPNGDTDSNAHTHRYERASDRHANAGRADRGRRCGYLRRRSR